MGSASISSRSVIFLPFSLFKSATTSVFRKGFGISKFKGSKASRISAEVDLYHVVLAHCRQPEDTGIMINGRTFFIKSELSGSMKSDAFEYEIAVTSVRNRRFTLVHFIGESEPKEGCIFVNCVSPLGYEFWNRCDLDTRQTENLAVNRRI